MSGLKLTECSAAKSHCCKRNSCCHDPCNSKQNSVSIESCSEMCQVFTCQTWPLPAMTLSRPPPLPCHGCGRNHVFHMWPFYICQQSGMNEHLPPPLLAGTWLAHRPLPRPRPLPAPALGFRLPLRRRFPPLPPLQPESLSLPSAASAAAAMLPSLPLCTGARLMTTCWQGLRTDCLIHSVLRLQAHHTGLPCMCHNKSRSLQQCQIQGSTPCQVLQHCCLPRCCCTIGIRQCSAPGSSAAEWTRLKICICLGLILSACGV